MTYEQTVQEIINKGKFGEAPGVVDIQNWMKILGPIDQGMQVIHIAGTNGKGSTSVMVANILAVFGYRVGLFTSPHLKRFTERIRLVEPGGWGCASEIPEDDFARIASEFLSDERLPRGNMLDYTLMIALTYFEEQQVDYVVLETGLGGKLDSTNGITVTPVVSAITSISLEHTAILGDTVAKIAAEKAGIIKAGTKVVIGCMQDEAAEVIADECEKKAVPYRRITEDNLQNDLVSIGYQRRNEACARAIIDALDLPSSKNLKMTSEEMISRAMQKMNWPGRLEILSAKNPWFMVDGAHNPEGVRVLRDSLKSTFPGEKFVFIMGVLRDRKYKEMIRTILPIAEEIWTVTPNDERALPAEELATIVRQMVCSLEMESVTCQMARDLECRACSISEAVTLASRERRRRVVALGSLYFIGELRDEFSIQN